LHLETRVASQKVESKKGGFGEGKIWSLLEHFFGVCFLNFMTNQSMLQTDKI
jgi:hypothetical protein